MSITLFCLNNCCEFACEQDSKHQNEVQWICSGQWLNSGWTGQLPGICMCVTFPPLATTPPRSLLSIRLGSYSTCLVKYSGRRGRSPSSFTLHLFSVSTGVATAVNSFSNSTTVQLNYRHTIKLMSFKWLVARPLLSPPDLWKSNNCFNFGLQYSSSLLLRAVHALRSENSTMATSVGVKK